MSGAAKRGQGVLVGFGILAEEREAKLRYAVAQLNEAVELAEEFFCFELCSTGRAARIESFKARSLARAGLRAFRAFKRDLGAGKSPLRLEVLLANGVVIAGRNGRVLHRKGIVTCAGKRRQGAEVAS